SNMIFFFQAEDGIRALIVTGVQTCALPIFGVGAPSYTSGVHMWNGTAEILKQKPANRKTSPNTRPMPPSPAALAMPTKLTVPVKIGRASLGKECRSRWVAGDGIKNKEQERS